MASTYTADTAVGLATAFVHGIPLDTVKAEMCDTVNSIIWNSFYWRWSIGSITPFTLINGQQDYSNVLPVDFFRIKGLRISRTDITPNEFREMNIVNFLAPDINPRGNLNSIRAASIEPSLTLGVRLEMAPNIASPTVLQIAGEYQKQPTKITLANMSTVFSFPDQYFPVFLEGLKWKIYQFADDQRAGSLQVDRSGNREITGQLGVFYNALNDMQRSEDYGDGQADMHPEDPLGWTRVANPGLYGF